MDPQFVAIYLEGTLPFCATKNISPQTSAGLFFMPPVLPPAIKKGPRRNALQPEVHPNHSARHEEMMQRFQIRRVSSYDGTLTAASGSQKLLVNNPTQSKMWPHPHAKHHKPFFKKWCSPITPQSWVSTLHGLLMLAVYHFQIIYLPFAPSYYPNGSPTLTIIAIVLESSFFVDLLLNFNSAYLDQGLLVTSRKKIARNYIRKWFAFDVLSAMPIQVIYCSFTKSLTLVHPVIQGVQITLIVLRLLRTTFLERGVLSSRTARVDKHVTQRLQYSRYSHLLGIAQLMWVVLVIAHYMACLWHAVSKRRDFNYNSVGQMYVADYYYAVSLIQGTGNSAGFWGENLYSSVAIIVGSGILATVFGNVAMLVSNFNANTTNYHRKMEAVHATMDKMGLPSTLRERVNEYYTHVWLEYEALDGNINKFQQELTHTLRLEIGLFKHRELVVKTRFWADCTPDFISQIVLSLGVRVYMPDDYIFRRQEVGHEMMMINMGYCKLLASAKYLEKRRRAMDNALGNPVLSQNDLGSNKSSDLDDESDDHDSFPSVNDVSEDEDPKFRRMSGAAFMLHRGVANVSSGSKSRRRSLMQSRREANAQKKVYAFLNPGQAFGEMSLLMNYKRKTTIRAVTFVEMCVLDRKTFQSIISRYPSDRRRVLTKMLENCIEKKEIPFPWEDIVEAVTVKRLNNGFMDISRANVIETMTAGEAAKILVEAIDVNTPDESIKYGFQSFDEEFVDESRVRHANSIGAKIRETLERRNSGIRRANSDSVGVRPRVSNSYVTPPSRRNSMDSGRSSATADLTESEPDISIASYCSGNATEKTLESMMQLMHTMVRDIGRLKEDLSEMKARKCCCTCDCKTRRSMEPRPSKDKDTSSLAWPSEGDSQSSSAESEAVPRGAPVKTGIKLSPVKRGSKRAKVSPAFAVVPGSITRSNSTGVVRIVDQKPPLLSAELTTSVEDLKPAEGAESQKNAAILPFDENPRGSDSETTSPSIGKSSVSSEGSQTTRVQLKRVKSGLSQAARLLPRRLSGFSNNINDYPPIDTAQRHSMLGKLSFGSGTEAITLADPGPVNSDSPSVRGDVVIPERRT